MSTQEKKPKGSAQKEVEELKKELELYKMKEDLTKMLDENVELKKQVRAKDKRIRELEATGGVGKQGG